MKRKKILMASCNYWTSPFQVGSHHIARGLIDAGWDVGFVASPISPLHFAGSATRELRERLAIYRAGGIRDLDGHLWTYVPGALAVPTNKPLLRGSWVCRRWASLSWPNLVRTIKHAGFGKVDLLYFDNINYTFLLDNIEHDKSLLRIADRNDGFEVATPVKNALERRLARSVDVVVYTAKNLKGYVDEMRPKQTLHVPNGVNFKHFAEGSRALPPEYKNIQKPIALYVGAMDAWFDHALVNKAARALPNVSFVLIGSDELARARLEKLSNIHLLGRRSYDELPPYLHHADVGLIPFDVDRHAGLVNSIHPLKLYEYMACGLPVVAVEWEELRNINSPARLCQGSEQFIRAIADAVGETRDSAAYINFAEGADWSARVRLITDFLDGLIARG